MKEYVEFYCYYDFNAHDFINLEIIDLIKKYELTVQKGWEHGLHLKIFGYLKRQEYKKVSNLLKNLIEKENTTYDIENFKSVHSKVAKILEKENFLEDIIINKCFFNNTLLNFKENFNNNEQLNMYIKMSKVMDHHFLDNYFIGIDLKTVLSKVISVSRNLKQTVLYNNPRVISDGYVSHLSHYIGFLNSLNDKNKRIIIKEFEKHTKNLDGFEEDSTLKEQIFLLSDEFKTLINNKKYNFFSPFDEIILDEKYKASSIYHQPIYYNETIKNKVKYDEVLCFNKFFLNILYEKLLVMNITPKEKFFLNYVIANEKYNVKEYEL